MSFESLLNRTIDLKRKTDKLVDSAIIAASMAIDRNPAEDAYTVLTVAGCTDGTGEVTVTGTSVAGAPQVETLTFEGNMAKQGIKQFRTVTGITTSGFVGETTVGTLEVKAVTQMGEPIYFEDVIQASIPARIDEISGRLVRLPQGQAIDATHKAFLNFSSDFTPAEDDVLVEGSVNYKVKYANKVHGRQDAHHWQLLMDQL